MEQMIGSTMVGERGQVVIPKNIRDGLGLRKGSKLLAMRHPNGACVLLPADQLKDFVKVITKKLKQFTV